MHWWIWEIQCANSKEDNSQVVLLPKKTQCLDKNKSEKQVSLPNLQPLCRYSRFSLLVAQLLHLTLHVDVFLATRDTIPSVALQIFLCLRPPSESYFSYHLLFVTPYLGPQSPSHFSPGPQLTHSICQLLHWHLPRHHLSHVHFIHPVMPHIQLKLVKATSFVSVQCQEF